MKSLTIYTDGSCNHSHGIGGWAAIVRIGEQKLVLKGKELNTTHQRMELTAVLRALEYLELNQLSTLPVKVYTDSQYVINLQKRRPKLVQTKFVTKKNLPIRNVDLVEKILDYVDKLNIEFLKVEAHQKVSEIENLNREVDKLARSIVREHLRALPEVNR